MAGDTKTGGARILRSIFVHIVEIEVTCPLCGAATKVMFHREEPADGFSPPLVKCSCGRYEYGHSLH